jgi:hypothetical protein
LFASVTTDEYVLDFIEDQVRAQVPVMLERVRTSPEFQSYTPQHQTALLASLETVPRVFRAEFARELAAISHRVGPRFAQLMTADDLLAAAAAIREPENQVLLREMVTSSFSGVPSESAFPDLTRTDAGKRFLETQAGQIFQQARPRLDQIVADESEALASFGPRMRLLGMALACDALEDECPLTTRQRLGRI